MYGTWDYRLSTFFSVKCARTILVVLFSLNLAKKTTSLRLINMTLPSVADPNDDMTLDCHFDMGVEELYAVKWYKDDQEFFRYMPRNQPTVMMFPVAGVHMVPQGTSCGQSRCKVRLTGLKRDHSGGAYRCEVSSEAPAFRLASGTHNVTIAVLPREEPIITELQESYRAGDLLHAECKSSLADPPPLLTWYINDMKAPEEVLGDSISSHPDDGGLSYRSLPIRFQVDRKYAQGNLIRLRCVSVIPGIPVPPQSAHQIVRVSPATTSSQVNNEKLHWPSAANKARPRINSIILTFAAVITSHFLSTLHRQT